MIPYVQDPDFTLYVGDACEVLAELPAASVDCCVTSPPYWGLRDYGTDGQLGLEATPQEYVAALVGVFAEVWRVLRPEGTLWLNLGSSYKANESGGLTGSTLAKGGKQTTSSRAANEARRDARRYDTSCTGSPDSLDLGSACRDLCDEHLAVFLSHRARTVDTLRLLSQDGPPSSPTDRGSAPPGSEQASPDASPPDAQESTTPESWLRLRGPCSRCDSRASALSGVRSSSPDVPASARNSWLNYTFKPKDMVPIPWLVAMALQADGWYLRADVIWSKSNPMPESVTDRPTKAHEYVFLLSKQPRYYFDQDAVREPANWERWGDQTVGAGSNPNGWIKPRPKEHMRVRNVGGRTDGYTYGEGGAGFAPNPDGRNIRSVWEIPTSPYPDAHFAVFPEELPRRCILAGCPEGGTVLDPFLGSGTTAKVARDLGRSCVGIELNPAYAALAAKRLQQLSLLA